MEAEVLQGGRAGSFERLSPRYLISRRFGKSILIGYGLAFADLGYVTLFYIIGSRYFGVWSPGQVLDYDNGFSTLFPWVSALLVGLVAATMEEFFFRLLAISLLLKWTGKRWLSVLLPAVVWGFLHSSYAVEPIYTRGLELTLVGIVFGVVFLRWGIWASVISHYAYNAFLVSFPMLRSSSTYFQVSGLVVVGILLIPAAVALYRVAAGRRRDKSRHSGRDEEADSGEAGSVQAPAPGPYSGKGPGDYALSGRQRLATIACCIVGVLIIALVKVPRFGEASFQLTTSREQAVEAAQQFAKKIGRQLPDHRRAVTWRDALGSRHFTHLIRKAGHARASALANENAEPRRWAVRWFRPLESEELRIEISPGGRVVRFEHKLPKNRPGEDLSRGKSQEIAARFVARHFGDRVTDSSRYKLLEATSEKLEARRDHEFIWERTDVKVEDGEFRVRVRVQGDQVGHVSHFYKAPEAFLRHLQEKTLRKTIVEVARVLLMMATLIFAAIAFFRAYRGQQLRLREAVRMGIVASVIFIMSRLNDLQSTLFVMNTQESMATFLGGKIIGLLMSTLTMFLMTAATWSLAVHLFEKVIPDEMTPARWWPVLRSPLRNRVIWTDSLLASAAVLLLSRGLGRLDSVIHHHWLHEFAHASGRSPSSLDAHWPFLKGVGTAALLPFSIVLAIGFLLLWFDLLKRRSVLVVIGILTGFLLAAMETAEAPVHLAGTLGGWFISILPVAILIVSIVRYNLLAYLMSAWLMLFRDGWSLFETNVGSLQANGVALMVMASLPLVIVAWAWISHSRGAQGGGQSGGQR